jgi:IgGFc binding protein
MKRLVFLIVIILNSTTSFSQDYSNKGKEFWIAYSSHIDGKETVMGIYITSDKNAVGNISVNGSNIAFTVIANKVTKKFLGAAASLDGSNSYVYLDMQDGIKTNAAIKITADVPIVVYTHIINSARSGATLVLPTQVLGTEYIVPSHQSTGGNANKDQPNIGVVSVIATQPNTIIEIKPTIAGRTGKPAGVAFYDTLINAGDCYQFHGVATGDLSGTSVKSIASSTSGCKPIAVFSATTWSAFDCQGASGGDIKSFSLFVLGESSL